jgi:hypothetical protein
MTTLELRKRLKRDPSMMSRLYKEYAENRDLGGEAILLRKLNSTTQRLNPASGLTPLPIATEALAGET